MSDQVKEKNEAIAIIDRILPLLCEAKSKLKSARNWGFVDMLGGGFFTDLIKHSKINGAANLMNQVSYLLQELQREVKDIQFSSNYQMNTGILSTAADFLFDGIIADTYMQSKIFSSIDAVENLERNLLDLRARISSLN